MRGRLTFQLVDENPAAIVHPRKFAPPGENFVAYPQWPHLTVFDKVLLDGSHIVDARNGFAPATGEPDVVVRFDAAGTAALAEITRQNTGRHIAVIADGEVLMVPVITEPILNGSLMINGAFTVKRAEEIAALLSAGALPAPVRIVESGPGLTK